MGRATEQPSRKNLPWRAQVAKLGREHRGTLELSLAVSAPRERDRAGFLCFQIPE